MALGSVDPSSRPAAPPGLDPEEAVSLLLRDLRASEAGLSGVEAGRRLVQYGPNELHRRTGPRWPRELLAQLTHPLALLLAAAAGLSFAVGNRVVGIAVLLVIALNAAFALVQELQAERAVEALARYLPQMAEAVRDGQVVSIDVAALVPGDIVVLSEGERVPADVRLIDGTVTVDMSALTGESAPVMRSAELVDVDVPRLSARDLAFMGATCTEGEARALVFATGMHTELGRVAALTQHVESQRSPLERQVRRVAWLIAAVAIAMAVAFVPLAMVAAGLSLRNSVVFAVGLLAGNVPEGLLPVITLALAVAVRSLAARGAVVKRLSAVETLGSTDVICTDKTGTLTENRMRPVAVWTRDRLRALEPEPGGQRALGAEPPDRAETALAVAAVAANNARLQAGGAPMGDPTEIALMQAGAALGADIDAEARQAARQAVYHFEAHRKLMSTAEHGWLHTKGAPEAVLARCATVLDGAGQCVALDPATRESFSAYVQQASSEGMRLIAVAQRRLTVAPPGKDREVLERELTLLGMVAMEDPPRPEVAAAVASCHAAGIRIIVITGDHPLTAAAIARRVGIGGPAGPQTVLADALESMPAADLRGLLAGDDELVFARAAPEAKLRIAELLRDLGHVVAMTGDGVNDAPALRRADIGVAMGRSGTDVAREAATVVLSDDNFATIVVAVHAGRRVYDNVRKFIVYIFAHATPEVVPFIVFAFGGGLIPLPLTVVQLLAFDVGSETLPSLALGRDPAEPDVMARGPRPADEGVIRAPMLVRAWLFLGVIVAGLQMAGFFFVLHRAGWHPGAAVGPGQPLHRAYLEATTMSLVGMMAGQIGTAFAVRTRRAPLRAVGAASNRGLLAAIAGVLALAAAVAYFPPLQELLATAPLSVGDLLFLAPYPVIVWGADELRKAALRHWAPAQRAAVAA